VDHFALGLFHDQTTWFQKTLSLATPEAVAQAIAFLESRRDSGGTELGVALEQALRLPRTAGGLARHLLIMTDAQVTDAGRLLGLADAEAARPDRRRISLLCVDAAPNAFLALQLAERGGGAARFLTSAPEEADITTALDEVLADWAAPVAVGLCLEANRSAIQAAGRPVTGSAVDLGDLPAGRAVWVASRVPASGPEMSLRLLTGDGQELATWQAPPAPAAQPALKALFGARRVLALEHLVHAAYDPPTLRAELARLGYDSAVVLGEAARAVYAENARLDAEASLKKLLVAEALECGVASSETAFVATRREAGKPVESTVVVANALPAGWSEEFLAPVSMGMPAPPPAPTPFPGAGVLRSMAIADPGAAGAVQYARAARASVGAQPAARHTRQVIADEASAGPISSQAEIFRDAPRFVGNRAILFDSAAVKADPLPAGVTLTGLEIAFAAAAPATLDPGLALEIYVDDLSAPRARVRLADMAQQGWRRPLNLRREAGQRVVIALQDRAGAWAAAAPELRVILRW
jgi:Ca-activated chloride channel family protein